MRAPAGKCIRRLCAAQIFRIEIAVHQNFGMLQNERAVEIGGSLYFHHARKVLPEIVHELALRRADDLFDGDSLHGAHKLAHLRHERLFIERNGDGRERLSFCRKVLRLPVVDAAFADKTLACAPAFVRGENTFSVRNEVGADGGLFSVCIALSLPCESAAIPSLGHREREDVFALFDEGRYVVLLHLQGLVVRRPAGREIPVSHPHAVHFRKVHAQSRSAQCRFFCRTHHEFLFQGKDVRPFLHADKFSVQHGIHSFFYFKTSLIF